MKPSAGLITSALTFSLSLGEGKARASIKWDEVIFLNFLESESNLRHPILSKVPCFILSTDRDTTSYHITSTCLLYLGLHVTLKLLPSFVFDVLCRLVLYAQACNVQKLHRRSVFQRITSWVLLRYVMLTSSLCPY